MQDNKTFRRTAPLDPGMRKCQKNNVETWARRAESREVVFVVEKEMRAVKTGRD